uniref:Uncharacterized protein n=1 Tax=Eutreptiella gymnastica TaxID=73025 RepID=A0A7S4FQH3_9EUGL
MCPSQIQAQTQNSPNSPTVAQAMGAKLGTCPADSAQLWPQTAFLEGGGLKPPPNGPRRPSVWKQGRQCAAQGNLMSQWPFQPLPSPLTRSSSVEEFVLLFYLRSATEGHVMRREDVSNS